MKRTAALRLTGEICLYFSILTLFSVFQRWQLPMAGFALACLVVGFIAVGLKSAPLRLVLSLIPGVCFLFTALSWQLIFPGLAWLYFILYLGYGHFGVSLYEYRGAFRWMLIISAFILAGQTVNSMLFGGRAISYVSLAFLAAFVLLEIVALRGMQMGAPMDFRWHTANLLTVVCTLVLTVGISLLLYQLYTRSIPIVLFLVSPLKRLLGWLVGLIRFSPVTQTPAPSATPEVMTILIPQEAAQITGDEEEYLLEVLEEGNSARLADQALTVGAFLIICILLFLAVWIIVKLVRRGKEFAEEGVDYEQTEGFTPERGRRKARPAVVHGKAQTVRKIYREYLDYLKENGLQRTSSDTSAEILAESERISGASAAAEETLRRIYLKARYSAATVTEADVDAARESLSAIRSREKT